MVNSVAPWRDFIFMEIRIHVGNYKLCLSYGTFSDVGEGKHSWVC